MHKVKETCDKGKCKGNGGKGKHASKGGEFGGKGAARMMKGDEEEDERVQVAPNMGAAGSYPQATSDPEEEEATEEEWHEPRKEQRIVKWADCSDDEQGRQEELAEEREDKKRVEQAEAKCREGEAEQGREGGRAQGKGREEHQTGEESKEENGGEEGEAERQEEKKRREEQEERRLREERDEEKGAQEARERERSKSAGRARRGRKEKGARRARRRRARENARGMRSREKGRGEQKPNVRKRCAEQAHGLVEGSVVDPNQRWIQHAQRHRKAQSLASSQKSGRTRSRWRQGRRGQCLAEEAQGRYGEKETKQD